MQQNVSDIPFIIKWEIYDPKYRNYCSYLYIYYQDNIISRIYINWETIELSAPDHKPFNTELDSEYYKKEKEHFEK